MDRKMTVGKLIEKLQKFENQDAVVVVTSSNFELNQSTIPASHIHQFKGKIESRTFRDAFDGGSYNTNVITRSDDGDTEFIQIF